MKFPNNPEHYHINDYIWTESEDVIIINNFKEKGYKWCANYLNRTEKAIQRRASFLGVTKQIHKYTKEEEDFLRANYVRYGSRYCAEKLGRTMESISTKASKMHLGHNSYYTKEEEDFLKNNYKLYTNKELSNILERTVPSITSKLRSMGLVKYDNNHKDDNWLKENYSILGTNKCAEELGITKYQVFHRAKRLGLKVDNKTYGKSKYRYVQWDNKSKKWKVIINNINGKKKQFGLYDDEDEAGIVAMEKAIEYGKVIS